MNQELSDKFRGFVFDESPDNGNEDVIKTLNLVVAQGKYRDWETDRKSVV